MPGTHEGKKRASYPLGLEIQTIVSIMWMVGIEFGSSGRIANMFNQKAISLALHEGPKSKFFELSYRVIM